MLADHDLQQMYELAHYLHPDSGVALSVTLEACDRIMLLQRIEDRRTGHYRRRLPEACLRQYCVYLASDARERDQERPRPGQDPRYQPAPDDYLVRYIKCLIWWTMDRTACHVAVALGCFLYRYPLGALVRLVPALCDSHQIQRIRVRLTQQLQARFPRAHLFEGDQTTLRTRPPTEHERRLVQQSLAMFTPWEFQHVLPHAPTMSILETYFAGASARSDWDQIHALIDPTCAGLSRLIHEYNESLLRGSQARLEDPDDNLAIPCFTP
jgi:hypothetical protein